MLDFIEGGPGDLCRLYMQDGEVVAYGVPPGGGAVPALAFLSIMAQTTAVPLAPGSQESDVLYFCEQFNAKHLRAALSFRHDTVDYVGQVLGRPFMIRDALTCQNAQKICRHKKKMEGKDEE